MACVLKLFRQGDFQIILVFKALCFGWLKHACSSHFIFCVMPNMVIHSEFCFFCVVLIPAITRFLDILTRSTSNSLFLSFFLSLFSHTHTYAHAQTHSGTVHMYESPCVLMECVPPYSDRPVFGEEVPGIPLSSGPPTPLRAQTFSSFSPSKSYSRQSSSSDTELSLTPKTGKIPDPPPALHQTLPLSLSLSSRAFIRINMSPV